MIPLRRLSLASASLPLLDTVPGALTAASSRRLSSAYAGAALRLRDTGSGVQADYAPGAAMPAGQALVSAYDQTGSGRTWTQPTASSQPLIAGTAAAWAFGAGKALPATSLPTSVAAGDSVTIAVVVERAASAADQFVFRSPSGHLALVSAAGALIYTGFQANATSAASAVPAARAILVLRATAGTGTPVSARRNGATILSATPTGTGRLLDGLSLGNTGADRPWLGSISEVVIWPSYLSDATCALIEANMNAHHAIY